MKRKSLILYFMYAWIFLFSLLPLVLVFIVSFLSSDQEQLIALPWTLHNYLALCSLPFLKILIRSLLIATLSTLACLLIGYPLSYFFIKSKHQSLLLLLLMIPFWTSSLIRTYALISILKLNGLLNTLLLKLHLIQQPLSWLYSNVAVSCGLIYNLLPFMVLPLVSNMERFDFRLIEAAKDLGAGRLAIFFRVFLPNTLPGIIAGGFLVFLPAMTLFYIPNVLGGARSVLLGNLIQSQFLVSENWPEGAATSMVLTLFLFGLILFYESKKRRGISS